MNTWAKGLFWIDAVTKKTEWDIEGLDGLNMDTSYLLICNHQSAVDILALFYVFNERIPPMKYFLKRVLFFLPIIGWACWAMDFPFMRRYTSEYLKKNPHMRGKDIASARKSCEKFTNREVTIVNYIEGTRITPVKHQRQKSPYRHLLKPRAGGISYVLYAMNGKIQSVLNVTIIYPDQKPSFWGYISGSLKKISIRVEAIPVTEDLVGNYVEDDAYRQHFQAWLNGIWNKKDQMIEDLTNR